MCGRFALQIAWRDVAEALGLSPDEAARNVPARHNIAPSQDIPIVIDTDGGRQRLDASWGLVPRWAKWTAGTEWSDVKVSRSAFLTPWPPREGGAA